MIGVKAFFYEYKYYLYPDGCDLSQLKRMDHVRVQRLTEEFCMAPNFVEESIVEEDLAIENPERLFDVDVNLYTREEYDALLKKQVERVCKGCVSFGGDSSDLTGHHREMGLDGVCYLREEESSPWDFATCIQAFSDFASERIDELAACIDRGDQKKLNRILNSALSKLFTELNFVGAKKDGQYFLFICSSPETSDVSHVLNGYVAQMMMKIAFHERGWQVMSYRAAGIYPYMGKTTFDGNVCTVYPLDEFHCGIRIYAKNPSPRKQETMLQDFDDLLCSLAGENAVRTFVMEYAISDDAPKSTVKEAANALLARYFAYIKNLPPETGYPYPVPYGVDESATAVALPLREGITEGYTRCTYYSFLGKEDADNMAELLRLFPFAYLVCPTAASDPELSAALLWYLSNADKIPEPYRNPEDPRISAANLGMAFCRGGEAIVDFAVASENLLLRTLRALAPVLQKIGATLVFVKGENVTRYRCGYTFTEEHI